MARSPRRCEICGKQYVPTYHKQRTCGRLCGTALWRQLHGHGWPIAKQPAKKPTAPLEDRYCLECRQMFTPTHGSAKLCSDNCRRRRNSRASNQDIKRRYKADPEFRDLVISRAQNRHANKLGIGSITTPAALIAYLMKRDHELCQIPDCQFPDRRIRDKHGPGMPSIDHIVPRNRGGQHALENLQLAHYRCNLVKGDRGGGEQLALIG